MWIFQPLPLAGQQDVAAGGVFVKAAGSPQRLAGSGGGLAAKVWQRPPLYAPSRHQVERRA